MKAFEKQKVSTLLKLSSRRKLLRSAEFVKQKFESLESTAEAEAVQKKDFQIPLVFPEKAMSI